MKSKLGTGRGFTLVEIIVVMAVISVLMMVVFASFSESRKKARDTARIADMQQLAAALQVYAATYGKYPSATEGACTWQNSFNSGGCLRVLVTTGLLPVLPTDPINEATNGSVNRHHYFYDNWCQGTGTSNKSYRMWTLGETPQGGIAKNWWHENTIGMTTCADPS